MQRCRGSEVLQRCIGVEVQGLQRCIDAAWFRGAEVVGAGPGAEGCRGVSGGVKCRCRFRGAKCRGADVLAVVLMQVQRCRGVHQVQR